MTVTSSLGRFATTLLAVAVALPALAEGRSGTTSRRASPDRTWKEHDAGWMSVKLPPGWTFEAEVDGGACPLAHVRLEDGAGAWVYFGLDMECGGEWNDGQWKIRLEDDGRVIVTDAPAPRKCRNEIDAPPECGHVDYLIAAGTRFAGTRYLTVEVGHRKRRNPRDLRVLRAIVESALVRPKRLPAASY